jgi:hypothetical protein
MAKSQRPVVMDKLSSSVCTLVPSAQNGGLPVKLVPKIFDFTITTPSLAGKRLVRAMQCTQFRAKSAEDDL